MLMNEAILGTLVTVKAKYLLNAIHSLMLVPAGHPDRAKKFVTMEDLHASEVRDLHTLLGKMCKDDFKESFAYILDVESRFSLRRPDSPDVDTWSSMWHQVLKMGVVPTKRVAIKEGVSTQDILKLLPPAETVVTSTFHSPEKGKGGAEQGVKEEISAPTGGADVEAQVEASTTTAYFNVIYTLSSARSGPAKENATHTLDVLALQAAVQQQLLLYAGSLGDDVG